MDKRHFLLAALLALTVTVFPMAVRAQTTEAPVRDLQDNQTILRVITGFGKPATVFINGEQVPVGPRGDYSRWVDITAYTHPGENTVRVSGEKLSQFDVTISHAETRGKFRRLASFGKTPLSGLAGAGAPKGPNYEYRFTLPGDAAVDVSGRKPRAGSQENQTLLVTGALNPITAYVNGKRVGDFQNGNKLDISNFVKSGENTLRVTWKGEATGFAVRIAHAEQKNAFRDITMMNVLMAQSRKPGEQEQRFVLP